MCEKYDGCPVCCRAAGIEKSEISEQSIDICCFVVF